MNVLLSVCILASIHSQSIFMEILVVIWYIAKMHQDTRRYIENLTDNILVLYESTFLALNHWLGHDQARVHPTTSISDYKPSYTFICG